MHICVPEKLLFVDAKSHAYKNKKINKIKNISIVKIKER